MTDTSTAAPAGDSAQPVSDNSALSLDDAVALLGPDKKQDETPEKKEPAEPEPAPSDVPDQPAEEAEPAAGEADQPEAETSEPEPDGEEPEDPIIHGNARMRLRDGRLVLVAEGKKALERVPELERQVAETEARVRQELVPELTQAQHKQKVLDELLPLAVHAVQSQLPPEPDAALWDSDPVEAIQQQRRHDTAKARFQQLRQAQDAQAAEQQQAHNNAVQSYLKEQQAALLTARPDLKEPEKAKAFYATFLEAAQSLGVSQEQADTVHDHRIVLGVTQLYEKAKKWDALQAQKPIVAEKQKSAVPVQAPTRRASPAERQSVAVEDMSKKLSKTGSLEDAVALLNALGR